eukprot:TRINITY_DN63063_c0_g1_i1.p1 TRINITY_DN63063_c0_g1~~TRINITY_DN63063_c0_g1_i1.p1  ORF type:complete len:216 (+),score=14.02 TRINITY_DN63063_c0_g1_i1:76-723(+)
MVSEHIKDPLVAKDMSVSKRALDGMSPTQEVCNAISMLSPSVVGLVFWYSFPEGYSHTPRTVGIILGCLLHLPFSVAYHVLLARRELADAIDNTPRRLDQIFIHIASIIFTWSLSTNFPYSILCTFLNLYFIFRLWCRCPDVLERMANVCLSVFAYGLTGLWRGDYWNFFGGALSFSVGGCAMILRFGGWGHSIMHLCLGGLTYHCLVAASEIQD